jgi:ribosomal protein S18 acetylase RimI-like enzyme
VRALEDAAFQPWRRASRASLRRSFRSPRQSVWVVPHPDRAGAVAAFLVLWHHRTRLRVYDVATDASLRRHGLGRALMAHAEGLARRAGCRDVSLEADARDGRLVRWYRGQGYAVAERLPRFYAGGRPAVRLRKVL